MPIPLEPLSGNTKELAKFSVCDIEAYKWTQFRVIGWYNGTDYIEYRTMYDFIEGIWEEEERVIFAHFGGIYDFMFIMKAILEETDYTIENMIQRGSGLLCFDMVYRDEKGKLIDKISFRDSSALLPFSLARLTKSFGVKHVKQDFNFETWDGKLTKKLLGYLKDDCRGLYECLEAYYNWDLIKKAGPAYTMASQAIRVFRLFQTKKIRGLNKDVDAFVRLAYFGGRTEIFKPHYSGKKKLRCYDVNSLYPDAMKNNEFPTNFSYSTYDYEPNSMGFYEATVEVPKDMYLPPLPCMHELKNSTKLIFPTGRFTGIYSTIELEYARSLGVKIISTGEGMIFQNGGYIFRGYIEALYKMRKEAQKKGDGVADILTKLLMNSCYGRFGLNTKSEEILFDDFSEGLKPHSEFPIKKYGGEVWVRLMTREKELDKSFSNVAISAWVTSLSRIHMHKLMLPVQRELYYMDTDSLFTTKKMKTGKEIGELKEEYSCTKAVFLLPKTYVVEDDGPDPFKKLAMKGFNRRKIEKFNYEDFFTALEGDLRHMNVVHDAKFAKFKTAAKKGNFTTLLPEQEKQIRAKYDKRTLVKIRNKYDTLPLNVG